MVHNHVIQASVTDQACKIGYFVHGCQQDSVSPIGVIAITPYVGVEANVLERND